MFFDKNDTIYIKKEILVTSKSNFADELSGKCYQILFDSSIVQGNTLTIKSENNKLICRYLRNEGKDGDINFEVEDLVPENNTGKMLNSNDSNGFGDELQYSFYFSKDEKGKFRIDIIGVNHPDHMTFLQE